MKARSVGNRSPADRRAVSAAAGPVACIRSLLLMSPSSPLATRPGRLESRRDIFRGSILKLLDRETVEARNLRGGFTAEGSGVH